MPLIPRLEDVIEMRGWKGMNRWWYERRFTNARAFRKYMGTGIWTVTLTRVVASPVNHIGNCLTARLLGPKPLLDILKSSGVHNLYSTLGRTIPANVLTFGTCEAIKFYADGQSIVRRYDGQRQSQSLLFQKNFIAGAISGGIASALFYPVESARRTVTIDMGFQNNRYFGVTHCLEQRYIQMGYKSFFRGMSICVFGSMIYRGLFFGTFELGKVNLLEEGDRQFSNVFQVALLTSAASGIAAQPFHALLLTYLKDSYYNWTKAGKPWQYTTKIVPRTLIGLGPVTLIKSVGAALNLTMFDRYKTQIV